MNAINNNLESNRGRGKSHEKRQKILVAAGDIFLLNGFEGTSMEQIAAAAGVSKQTVYSHFGNKEELFTAIIEYKCQSHDLAGDLFDLSRPVSAVLREFAHDLSTLMTSEDAICIYRACISCSDQRSTVAELFWAAGPQRIRDKLTHYLEQQQQLAIDNPPFAARHLISLIKGEVTVRMELGLPCEHLLDDLPEYLDSAIKLFIKGYSA